MSPDERRSDLWALLVVAVPICVALYCVASLACEHLRRRCARVRERRALPVATETDSPVPTAEEYAPPALVVTGREGARRSGSGRSDRS